MMYPPKLMDGFCLMTLATARLRTPMVRGILDSSPLQAFGQKSLAEKRSAQPNGNQRCRPRRTTRCGICAFDSCPGPEHGLSDAFLCTNFMVSSWRTHVSVCWHERQLPTKASVLSWRSTKAFMHGSVASIVVRRMCVLILFTPKRW